MSLTLTLSYGAVIGFMLARQKYKSWKDEKSRIKNSSLIPKKSIAVLGLQGAGKTSLLLKLGARIADTTSTGTLRVEKYAPFTIEFNGKELIINAGHDIGGGYEFLNKDENQNLSDLQDIVSNHDIILYLFDINQFLKKGLNPEREEDLARLKIIMQTSSNLQKTQNVKLFATHSNKLANSCSIEEARKLLLEMVLQYESEPLFDTVSFIDIANDNDINVVKKTIFS